MISYKIKRGKADESQVNIHAYLEGAEIMVEEDLTEKDLGSLYARLKRTAKSWSVDVLPSESKVPNVILKDLVKMCLADEIRVNCLELNKILGEEGEENFLAEVELEQLTWTDEEPHHEQSLQTTRA